ncbi:MAG: hypothetical protein IPM47_06330 [Sphingobacteriales bacterium]|nr:MAG: hypothetical protein IPM47_06330 [Sphingobacteriales bacterium]
MNKQERIEQITYLAIKLPAEQQTALINRLKRQILLNKAKLLNQSVKPNKVTMQDIVKETRNVRKSKNSVNNEDTESSI